MKYCLLYVALFILIFVFPTSIQAMMPHFTLHKLGNGEPCALIIGGIQGDEPGGFSAATLFITHYQITKGAVWVVPNLNFPSIIKRSRGIHGDMNRKFHILSSSDPEYNVVKEIQSIICMPGIDLVLNLHDGSGFYRPDYQSELFRPGRWGQCVIIDMDKINHSTYGHLKNIAQTAIAYANKQLLKPEHMIHLKNTNTDKGNKEMEKTLSWFAVKNGIPAFGLEASKSFPVNIRTYYHLIITEGFLKQLGIEFKRKFPMTPYGVYNALYRDNYITFEDNRVILPLDNARPRLLGSIPLSHSAINNISTSKPIIAIIPEKKECIVQYGNRTITRFKPDWRDIDTKLTHVIVTADGIPKSVHFGEQITIRNTFKVHQIPGYRVNAIGTNAGIDESNIVLAKHMFLPSYSLDKSSRIFRVEIYKGEAFAGMFLVKFIDIPQKNLVNSLTNTATKP